jgi:hypothetical protein
MKSNPGWLSSNELLNATAVFIQPNLSFDDFRSVVPSSVIVSSREYLHQ